MKVRRYRIASILTALFVPAMLSPNTAFAQGAHGSFLGGPWEIVVGVGLEGSKLRYPVTVEDENKLADLDKVIPVMGTPLKLKLTHYVPDLQWESRVRHQVGAGTVAQVSLSGPNLQQQMWLASVDPKKNAVKAPVGRLSLTGFADGKTLKPLVQEYLETSPPGYLTIESADPKVRVDALVRPGETTSVGKSDWRVTVLRYLPHYSLNTETREVESASEEPVNPAVEVRVENGQTSYTQWLWSEFPSFSHNDQEYPLQIQYHRIDFEPSPHHYILAAAPEAKPLLIHFVEGKYQIDPVDTDQSYPFDQGYTFRVEQVLHDAVVEEVWTNGKDSLIKPALIAELTHDDSSQEIVMTIGKPYHHKTVNGTVVFLFRPQPAETAVNP